MAVSLKVDAGICPYCEKPVKEHQSAKILCSKIQRTINRLSLIQHLSEQSALTVQPRDLSAIAEICGIIIKELND